MKKKKIINNLDSCETIKFEELQSYERNTLKESSTRDITKLKNSIVNDGFSFPVFVWEGHRYIIDGAGRLSALEELINEGFVLKDVPVVRIIASDIKQAKKRVLQASSQHGEVTQDSFNAFVEDIEIDIWSEDLNLPSISISMPDISTNEQDVEREYPDIDFTQVESNENRQATFKSYSVSCPECDHFFEVEK